MALLAIPLHREVTPEIKEAEGHAVLPPPDLSASSPPLFAVAVNYHAADPNALEMTVVRVTAFGTARTEAEGVGTA